MNLGRQQIPVLGVDATPLTASDLIAVLEGFIAEGTTRVVVGHNLHSVTLTLSDPAFRRLYEQSDVVLLDGAPILWLWDRTRKSEMGASEPAPALMEYRLGSTDWIPALGAVSGLKRIAILGAGRAANDGAVTRLKELVPGAAVAGMPGEGWSPEIEEAAVSWLKECRPQLVLVGLGMPLQEMMLQRTWDSLPPAVYCTVGGAIEQLAGIQKLAPRWLGRMGLEWAWRLILHPRRVAYRVFGEPWVLLALLLRRRLSQRR
jgi:N-acetylglucosaminyldiphosphoundecaprenol N-acetyl-beta-D-mannosaminyltransferase